MCFARRNSFPSSSFPAGTNRGPGTNYFNEINNLIRSQRIRSRKRPGTVITGQKLVSIRSRERSLKRGGFVGNEFPPHRLWCACRQKKHTHTQRHLAWGYALARLPSIHSA
jgi:hypothetical protein